MDAAVCAERQETDGLAAQAQEDIPKLSIAVAERVDRNDQSDSTRLGEVLCDWPFEPLFLAHPKLGGKEDPAPSGQSPTAPRLWMATMEPILAVPDVGTLQGVPRELLAAKDGSRAMRIGLISVDAKCAGARSEGNPHAACEVAGTGNGATDTAKRARRGKPRIQPSQCPDGPPRQFSTLPKPALSTLHSTSSAIRTPRVFSSQAVTS